MHLTGPLSFLLLALGAVPLGAAGGAPADLVQAALQAEARLDSRTALELFLEADRAQPGDAATLQKIAQQYSDLIVDLRDDAEKKRYAQIALGFAERAVALDPKNAVHVLSLAVCHGKLAVYSDSRMKIEYSRLVKHEAERAIALNADYAWAHHVLGRWHCEVAALSGAKKWFVRAIYGGLPAASAADGVRELRRAVELEPDELAHRLELGFAYLAAGEQDQARSEFSLGLAMPSRRKHDDAAKDRARSALEKLEERKR
jgi:tetratricopeptide (TPR) repeat protein